MIKHEQGSNKQSNKKQAKKKRKQRGKEAKRQRSKRAKERTKNKREEGKQLFSIYRHERIYTLFLRKMVLIHDLSFLFLPFPLPSSFFSSLLLVRQMASPDIPQDAVLRLMDDLQIQESVRLQNSLTQRCFNDCVTNFRQKTLDDNEELCVHRCVEKFLKHNSRVNAIFTKQQKMFEPAV